MPILLHGKMPLHFHKTLICFVSYHKGFLFCLMEKLPPHLHITFTSFVNCQSASLEFMVFWVVGMCSVMDNSESHKFYLHHHENLKSHSQQVYFASWGNYDPIFT